MFSIVFFQDKFSIDCFLLYIVSSKLSVDFLMFYGFLSRDVSKSGFLGF